MRKFTSAEKFILEVIESIESERISKADYNTFVTLKQLKQELEFLDHESKALPHELFDINGRIDDQRLMKVLTSLKDKKEIILVVTNDNVLVRSKIAEICRCLINLKYRSWTRENSISYWNLLPSTSTIKYIRQTKMVPAREISPEDAIKRVNDLIKEFPLHDEYKKSLEIAVKITLLAFRDYMEKRFPHDKPVKLREFQVKSFEKLLSSAFGHSKKNAFVITAGAGSGKSFAFLLAPISYILYSNSLGMYGCKMILIYPRVELTSDQFKIIKKYLESVKTVSRKFGWGSAANRIKVVQDAGSVLSPEERREMYSSRDNVPDILITNTETLKRRILNPLCSSLFKCPVRFLIFDEVHLYNGIQGTHVIFFIKRLCNVFRKHGLQTMPIMVGASATIADPVNFVSLLFSKSPLSIESVHAETSTSFEKAGVFHHVFIRARRGRALIGTLADLSSLIIHNRIGNLSIENTKDTPEDIRKTIGFADSLSTIGRWNYIFRDNEQLHKKYIKNKASPPDYSCTYYSIFHEPLSWWAKVQDFEESAITKLRNLCNECKAGKLISVDVNSISTTTEFYAFPPWAGGRKSHKLTTLIGCPFFEHGVCWWFSEDEGTHYHMLRFKNGDNGWLRSDNARSDIATAPQRALREERIKDPSQYFSASINHLLGLYGERAVEKIELKDTEYIPIHFLICSPVLEVGVDLPQIENVILFKALRSASSYKQKVGRAGRELGSNVLSTTLLSFSPVDTYFYRFPHKLTDPAYIEPINVKGENVDVIRSHLYSACFDFAAAEGFDIYNLRHEDRCFTTSNSIENDIKKLLEKISTDKIFYERLKKYLLDIHNNEKIVEEAIQAFYKTLECLLSESLSTIIGRARQSLISILSRIRIEEDAHVVLPDPSSLNIDYKKLINDISEISGCIHEIKSVLNAMSSMLPESLTQKIDELLKSIEGV